MKFVAIVCAIVYWGFVSSGAYANDMIELSFDCLFPPSPLKHTLDTCMRLYGDVVAFKDQALLPHEAAIAQDALLGQLLRLRASLFCVAQNNKPLVSDDKLYIIVMINRLETAYAEHQSTQEHGAIASGLLAEIKTIAHSLAARESL